MNVASRLAPFGVTIFTEMTDLAVRHGAINLGQGYPDWDGAPFPKEVAVRSITGGGADQYPPSAGIPELREAVADRYRLRLGRPIDPDTEVTITSGCTEALAATFLGLVEPGDEVVIIEPFYDAYPVDVALAGGLARHVTLRPPRFELDLEELAAAFSSRTRAVLVNTPHNPTGRVFTRGEMEEISRLCIEFDALAVCDEVYEEMTYDAEHLSLAAFDDMAERTITLSSVGKTFSLTGWKVGWAIAPPSLTSGIRAAHQYLTFTTPTPVQHGTAAALAAPESFYVDLRQSYRQRRDMLARGLAEIGFEVYRPQGTYFMMAGYSAFSDADDRTFARWLTETTKVAAIPPGAFYHRAADGSGLVRFAFCKELDTLAAALDRLGALRR
ncbi:pyridoxal phosphate-dependent aminotransferase [soil metagenome]